MYNILVIGDLHGSPIWKDIIKYHSNKVKLNKIVFLGDYIDSWDYSILEQFNNFKDIINYKLQNKNKVELLLGNHDVQYYLPMSYLNELKCSGFNQISFYNLNPLFNKYKNLFNIAYQYNNYLFTHAGLHKGWYKYRFQKFNNKNETIANALNREFSIKNNVIWDCGYIRGGSQEIGGPLWADKQETYKKPLANYHQIVGHSKITKITKYKINDNTSIMYCDINKLQLDVKGCLVQI